MDVVWLVRQWGPTLVWACSGLRTGSPLEPGWAGRLVDPSGPAWEFPSELQLAAVLGWQLVSTSGRTCRKGHGRCSVCWLLCSGTAHNHERRTDRRAVGLAARGNSASSARMSATSKQAKALAILRPELRSGLEWGQC